MLKFNWFGIAIGAVTGLVGFWVLGFFEVSPCSTMSMIIDDALNSPLYNYWLGFECEDIPSGIEWIALDGTAALVILGFSGAIATKIPDLGTPRNGAIAGGVVSSVGFTLRSISVSYGYFQQVELVRILCIGAVATIVGLLAGWVGGYLSKIKRLTW